MIKLLKWIYQLGFDNGWHAAVEDAERQRKDEASRKRMIKNMLGDNLPPKRDGDL